MKSLHWGIVWAFVGFLIIAIECYALGSGHSEYTLSHFLRLIRFDPIGRFVLIVLWIWLTFHVFFNPRWLGTSPGWRDLLVVLPLALFVAIWDATQHTPK